MIVGSPELADLNANESEARAQTNREKKSGFGVLGINGAHQQSANYNANNHATATDRPQANNPRTTNGRSLHFSGGGRVSWCGQSDLNRSGSKYTRIANTTYLIV
jgi:hypothetical protein